ncbi:MAG: ABC transporter permease [Eubacteriales bacterium]|nr:ABC transporter permease [Eubacteriales bacterium]
MNRLLNKLKQHQFLFEELVKRDFKKKYKGTFLGMGWSILSPLLTLLVMKLVFSVFFASNVEHITTYIFTGNIVFMFFNEATSQGMTSLISNASIFTKVNVPKYLFLLSKNVQTLINFSLTLILLAIFCVLDHIAFTWKIVLLVYPIVLLVLFNLGVSLILSALYVFFRDMQYLWSFFTMLLMYTSAIFYSIDRYSPTVQNMFLANPIYLFIRYFRKILIDASIPSFGYHLLMLFDVVVVLSVGCLIYKKNNTKFLYYV